MQQDVNAKRCPMAWLGEEMDYCIQEACAWWVEEAQDCAIAVLAGKAK